MRNLRGFILPVSTAMANYVHFWQGAETTGQVLTIVGTIACFVVMIYAEYKDQ